MTDNRETITIKLRPGKDDDLIAWWLSMGEWSKENPANSRNQFVKNVLRVGLQLPIPDPTSSSGIGAHELQSLRAELFNEWQRWTRELVDNLPSYVQTAVETALATAPQQLAPPPVEATQQIDEATAQERANKLKRASW